MPSRFRVESLPIAELRRRLGEAIDREVYGGFVDLATEDPEAVARLLMTQGQDVSAQVLKAMLTIVYALFDGKLPIG